MVDLCAVLSPSKTIPAWSSHCSYRIPRRTKRRHLPDSCNDLTRNDFYSLLRLCLTSDSFFLRKMGYSFTEDIFNILNVNCLMIYLRHNYRLTNFLLTLIRTCIRCFRWPIFFLFCLNKGIIYGSILNYFRLLF